MEDNTKIGVDELVVLSKFEGDPLPENEFERLTIHNGIVESHCRVEGGMLVGPVLADNLVGKDIGTLMSHDGEVN